jgi:hypothetical protein
MRRTTRRAAGWLALALLLAAGCQRLDFENTYPLEGFDAQEIGFSPPQYEQKVTVTVTTSPAVPVSAYLVKTSDLDAMKKDPAAVQALGKQEKSETIKFDATVPAKTDYTIYLVGTGKKTDAKVKVVGR